mgnify:CR=1 FL=1
MNDKRIMIVTQHFPPEIGAASNRVEHISRHLDYRGYEVYVITSQPSYPNRSLYHKMSPVTRIHNQSKVYRVPVIGGSGVAGRLIQQLSFLICAALVTLYLSLRYGIRTCITTSPPFTINAIGWLYRIVTRRNWLLEVRDLWPDSMIAVGATHERSWFYRWLKKIEIYFYRKANRVVVVTPNTRDILIRQGVADEKIEVITNGIPDWVTVGKTLDIRNELPAKFRVLYLGNLGRSQNLIQLLESAKVLKDYDDIEYIIIGDGLEKQKLIEYCQREQLTNVRILPAILEKEKILQWYESSDVGVVSLRENSLFRNVIPSKLFEYGGAGLPILYIGDGEGSDIVTKYRIGVKVDFDAISIARAILNRFKLKSIEKLSDETTTSFRQEFMWKHLIERYIQLIASQSHWGKGSD